MALHVRLFFKKGVADTLLEKLTYSDVRVNVCSCEGEHVIIDMMADTLGGLDAAQDELLHAYDTIAPCLGGMISIVIPQDDVPGVIGSRGQEQAYIIGSTGALVDVLHSEASLSQRDIILRVSSENEDRIRRALWKIICRLRPEHTSYDAGGGGESGSKRKRSYGIGQVCYDARGGGERGSKRRRSYGIGQHASYDAGGGGETSSKRRRSYGIGQVCCISPSQDLLCLSIPNGMKALLE